LYHDLTLHITYQKILDKDSFFFAAPFPRSHHIRQLLEGFQPEKWSGGKQIVRVYGTD
jgi:hypothetical protein